MAIVINEDPAANECSGVVLDRAVIDGRVTSEVAIDSASPGRGRVAGDRATGDGAAVGVVAVDAAAESGRVARDRTVGDDGVAAVMQEDPAAVSTGRIVLDRTFSDTGTAAISEDVVSSAISRSRIARDYAVCNGRVAEVAVHATSLGCALVIRNCTAGYGEIAVIGNDPSTLIVGCVSRNQAVGDRGTNISAEDSAAR